MRYLVIFGLLLTMLVAVGFAQSGSSQMMCASGDETFHFTTSDVVFIGTVTAVNPSESNPLWNYISFEIKHPFKGLADQSDITISTHQGSTYGFEPEIGSTYVIHASNAYGVDLFTSLCSDNKLLETEKDIEEMKNKLLEISTPPPLKQKQYGLAAHAIKCKDSLILVQKHDDSPACVKPVTKQHLIDRNWAETKSLGEIRQNPESIRQNIIRMEGEGRVSLYPENTCASIHLKLLAEQDMQRYKNDEKGLDENTNILKIDSSDLREIPHIEEIIYAARLIEFPYNDSARISFEGVDFVEYEFLLMDKMIEKYGGTQKDYFMKLDADYETRLTDATLQGFSNEFLAPQIIYNEKVYSIGGTIFWTSDESNLSMSVHLRDSADESKKSVVLTEDDMKSVPKIKEAIESIGTIKESVSASKGLHDEGEWERYREWFKQKSQERLNADGFRLVDYDNHLYSLGFGIC